MVLLRLPQHENGESKDQETTPFNVVAPSPNYSLIVGTLGASFSGRWQ
jgi:hypothetical protein